MLLNPRMPERIARALRSLYAAAPPMPASCLDRDLGNDRRLKLVALSKEALLASAAAVNHRLGCAAARRWSCVLPTFHVGGLGIWARATISDGRVIR